MFSLISLNSLLTDIEKISTPDFLAGPRTRGITGGMNWSKILISLFSKKKRYGMFIKKGISVPNTIKVQNRTAPGLAVTFKNVEIIFCQVIHLSGKSNMN